VDDIFATMSLPQELAAFKAQLQLKWEIADLSSTKFALSIAITQDHLSHSISLSQSAYIDCFLLCFDVSNMKSADMPIIVGLHLCRPDQSTHRDSNILKWQLHTPYYKLVGSLSYIAIATCLNITFTIGWLSFFLDCYTPEH
jgi:hypothetical protein